jgi:hypothetical protein
MQQKIIWIRFLIIGGIVSLFHSCGKTIVDENFYTETSYIYKNTTSENVIMRFYDSNGQSTSEDKTMTPSQEIKFVKSGEMGKGIIPPYTVTQKIVLYFVTSNKCVTYNSGDKIFNYEQYDNYNASMNNYTKNTIIFAIDQEELDIATTCN